MTVNNTFGCYQNILAKYFSIWYLFSYWLFRLFVPLLVGWRSICCITGLVAFLHFLWSLVKERSNIFLHRSQRWKFVSAVGKCRRFCRDISPFYSICLGNNAEVIKFLEIFTKNSFPRTKKEIFCKRKKDLFKKKIRFYKTRTTHVHLY